MSILDANPASMDPLEFARLVKKAPADELSQMMQSDRRTAILDQLFARMPDVFRSDRAGSMDAVIHWNIAGRPDGGADSYEMVIANGACELAQTMQREPKLTLTLAAADFVNLVTGNAHAVGLVMRGKLKTQGDLALTAKFPKLFDPPSV